MKPWLFLVAAMSVLPAAREAATPVLDWSDFYESVAVTGVRFSERTRRLDGKRVRIRGFAALSPPLTGGVFLTRQPFRVAHEAGETDLPFDAVAILWAKGLALPPVPSRPTVEGILRLDNRSHGEYIVTITLEDARPVIPREERRRG